MSTDHAPCAVCARNPDRMNSDFAECSHVDCPCRRKAWSERPQPVPRKRWPFPVAKDPRTPLLDGVLPAAQSSETDA